MSGLRSTIYNAIELERPARLSITLGRVIFCIGVLEAVLVFGVGTGALLAYSKYALNWAQPFGDVVMPTLVLALAVVAQGVTGRHYRKLGTDTHVTVICTGLACSIRAFSILVLYLFFFKVADNTSRGGIFVEFCLVALTVTVSRSAFSAWVRHAVASGRVVSSRIMVIAEPGRLRSGTARDDLIERLRDEGGEVVSVIRFPAGDTPESEAQESEARMIGMAVETCRTSAINSVVVLPSMAALASTERLVAALSEAPVTVHVIPFASSLGGLGTTHGQIGGQPAIVIRQTAMDTLNWLSKRAFDIVGAAAGLVMVLPVFLCIAVAIKLDSRGPVFFRQVRHGYGNRTFRVFKFRSMRVMEDGAAFRQATRNDPRVTRVGRLLRRTNLDELPQLLNVLRGDMSLVGPRPHPVALNDDFASRIRLYNRRHNLLPGITGWAQVNGHRGETDDEIKMRRRVEHDLWYVDNWSLPLDIRILFLTVFSSGAYKNAG